MIRPFLPWPDKRLLEACAPVDEIADDIHALWQDMIETMDAMPGVGLAAPQIGVLKQVAVVDASTSRDARTRLANPRVLEAAETIVSGQEGSPNLPGVVAQVKRPLWVVVAFLNDKGETEERRFDGLEARSVQHQIDHLAGRLYFHRLSKVKRDMLLKKARKAG